MTEVVTAPRSWTNKSFQGGRRSAVDCRCSNERKASQLSDLLGGTDALDNIALAHLFCNSHSYTWGQKAPAVARERLADRVLYGKHGPGRRDRAPDADAVALAAEITGDSD